MHCHFSDKLSYEDSENRRFFDIEISQLENALFIDLYVSPFYRKGNLYLMNLLFFYIIPTEKWLLVAIIFMKICLKKAVITLLF